MQSLKSAGLLDRARAATEEVGVDSDERDWEPDPYMEDLDDAAADVLFARIMNPVVKVYCRHTEPNFSLPWQRQRQLSSSSSGFAVLWGDGNRYLLTNAHSVEYHSQVRVKRRGDDRKYLAKVLAIGTECDLALLTVEREEFWEGMKPMPLGPMPSLQESVAVVGYPVGGDTISITAGVVSRIEVTSYVHGSTQLLGVQIDAAVNSGNSGGPVFNEVGQLVGVAFQSYAGSDIENVGWVIPPTVIEHFLTDYERNGRYTGFPVLGLLWQRMESDALRRHMQMQDEQRGVLVSYVSKTGSSAEVLRKGDVLTEFDGETISNDGTTTFRTGERIVFSYLVSKKFVGDTVPVRILRDGSPLDLNLTLQGPNFLVPPHLANGDPSYFVISGLVFTTVSEPYLISEYGSDFVSLAPVNLLSRVYNSRPKSRDEEVVVISQVLACDATIGYEDFSDAQVRKFNGKDVKNLKHLVSMIQSCNDEFLVFDLHDDDVLVLNNVEAKQSTAEILKVHNIPQQMSVDMLATSQQDEASVGAESKHEAAASS